MDVILFFAHSSNREGLPETNITGVYPPLGLATLAACLRESGHRPRLIDAHALGLPAERAAGLAPADFSGLLAFSTTTLNWPNTLRLIRACRRRAPRARLAVGGPHLDLYPRETLAFPEIDFGLIGEGDRTLPALVQALENSGDPLAIPGAVARRDGEVIFGPPPQVVDLDTVPLPAWDLLPVERYRALTVRHPFGTMVSGRGCPYHCAFCSQRYAGAHFHRMSPARLVREWMYLVKEVKVREIIHFDETFAIGEDYLAETAARVAAAGVAIPNSARARCDTLTAPLVRSLARTGTHTIHLGIEAGSDAALARMNKGIDVARVRNAVRLVKDAGLTARGYFMIAYPGDTPADYRDTVNLARSLPLDLASFTITVLNPGTKIYEESLARGEVADFWLAHAKGEAIGAVLPRARQGLGDEPQLRRLLHRAYAAFYLRPIVLWRLAVNRRLWRWIPSWIKALSRSNR